MNGIDMHLCCFACFISETKWQFDVAAGFSMFAQALAFALISLVSPKCI